MPISDYLINILMSLDFPLESHNVNLVCKNLYVNDFDTQRHKCGNALTCYRGAR